jgi:hypothetical protein
LDSWTSLTTTDKLTLLPEYLLLLLLFHSPHSLFSQSLIQSFVWPTLVIAPCRFPDLPRPSLFTTFHDLPTTCIALFKSQDDTDSTYRAPFVSISQAPASWKVRGSFTLRLSSPITSGPGAVRISCPLQCLRYDRRVWIEGSSSTWDEMLRWPEACRIHHLASLCTRGAIRTAILSSVWCPAPRPDY